MHAWRGDICAVQHVLWFVDIFSRSCQLILQSMKNSPAYSSLSKCEQRIVSKFCLESRLNGIELDPKKALQFVEIIKNLDKDKTQFRQRVAVSSTTLSPAICVHSFMYIRKGEMSQLKTDPQANVISI